ncbi:MAG: PEP-CTERM sorting domain-containing protein [Verrucomicrobiota bacterium]
MKKQLLAGLVGFLTLGSCAFGQGTVIFDNYNNRNTGFGGNSSGYGAPVFFSSIPQFVPPGQAGKPVNASFGIVFHLYYALGTVSNPSLITSVPVSGATTTITPAMPGFFISVAATIPNYSSGPITFLVTGTGSYNGAPLYAQSSPFTLPSIATGTTLPGPLDGMQSFVFGMPEPTTASLSLLGAAAWALSKRRQANRV